MCLDPKHDKNGLSIMYLAGRIQNRRAGDHTHGERPLSLELFRSALHPVTMTLFIGKRFGEEFF